MIVADTGAILALLDVGDRHHAALRTIYEGNPEAWVLPWAILPEVDHLVASHLGTKAQTAFLTDLAEETFAVEWGRESDLYAANRICQRYRALHLGLVDAVVMAVTERLRADAIATLDLRHFGAVSIKSRPRLLPRDA